MRQGLWHKSGIVLLMALAQAIDFSTSESVLQVELGVTVLPFVASYVCVMETVSILENITELTPELRGSPIAAFFADKFGSNSGGSEQAGQE